MSFPSRSINYSGLYTVITYPSNSKPDYLRIILLCINLFKPCSLTPYNIKKLFVILLLYDS